jgi:hypothetical protein
MRGHPDTGEKHWVIYNNLALRQHRDFTEADWDDAVNVGFFGDSFTENPRIPGPGVFSDVLDYLLNGHDIRVNVFNFGVDGYGTGQSYLYYHLSPSAQELDYVFYVFCENDIRNIYETQLFELSDEMELIVNPARRSSWHIKLIGKLHTTYFFLDLGQRFVPAVRSKLAGSAEKRVQKDLRREWRSRFHSPRAESLNQTVLRDEDDTNSARYAVIFGEILERWQAEVDASDGNFVVATLPRDLEELSVEFIAERHEVLDLYGELIRTIEGYRWEDIRFENDRHWNERGNMYFAIQSYRFLAHKLGLDPVPESELKYRLANYYAAFPEYWQPLPLDELPPSTVSAEELAWIRMRYAALEPTQADAADDTRD